MRMRVTVNGKVRSAQVHPLKSLLRVLREDLDLPGTKEGCGEGECGACAVLLDGVLVNSCCVPALQAAGREVLTVEGLGVPGEEGQTPDALQIAFVEEGAVHCGFCTPGMEMASRALLEENPRPTREEVRVALSGNLCRCTGYEPIYRAVDRAVREGYPASFRPRPNPCAGDLPEFDPEERGRFFAPRSLEEALAVLAEHPDATLLAGGTDILPDRKNRKADPEKVVDLFRLEELHGAVREGEILRLRACTTNGEILRTPLVGELLPALREASFRSGGPAIQNRATLGGNLANASGAADLPVVLLALGARVRLASARGTRTLSLGEFMPRYRENACAPGEILESLEIPVPAPSSRQRFYKRGSRKALTLSRVSLALFLEEEGGTIRTFRLAAGSMAPLPQRLTRTEEAVLGRPLDRQTADLASRMAGEEVQPRKSPSYRKAITANLVRRFFDELL